MVVGFRVLGFSGLGFRVGCRVVGLRGPIWGALSKMLVPVPGGGAPRKSALSPHHSELTSLKLAMRVITLVVQLSVVGSVLSNRLIGGTWEAVRGSVADATMGLQVAMTTKVVRLQTSMKNCP